MLLRLLRGNNGLTGKRWSLEHLARLRVVGSPIERERSLSRLVKLGAVRISGGYVERTEDIEMVNRHLSSLAPIIIEEMYNSKHVGGGNFEPRKTPRMPGPQKLAEGRLITRFVFQGS